MNRRVMNDEEIVSARLENDPDLAVLAGQPRFRALLDSLPAIISA